MNRWRRFDEWLLVRYWKFSLKTQSLVGVDCFDLAEFSIGGWISFLVLAQVPSPSAWWMKAFLVTGVLLGWLPPQLWLLKKARRFCRTHPQFINPQCEDFSPRSAWHLVVPVYAILPARHFQDVFWVAHALGMLSFFYFVACTPAPPAKSKLKEWLETPKQVPVLEGAP